MKSITSLTYFWLSLLISWVTWSVINFFFWGWYASATYEWMCIYILHISHHVSWRFTILLSEIGRQLVNATSCRYQSIFDLTHPPNPCMKWETGLKVNDQLISGSLGLVMTKIRPDLQGAIRYNKQSSVYWRAFLSPLCFSRKPDTNGELFRVRWKSKFEKDRGIFHPVSGFLQPVRSSLFFCSRFDVYYCDSSFLFRRKQHVFVVLLMTAFHMTVVTKFTPLKL